MVEVSLLDVPDTRGFSLWAPKVSPPTIPTTWRSPTRLVIYLHIILHTVTTPNLLFLKFNYILNMLFMKEHEYVPFEPIQC